MFTFVCLWLLWGVSTVLSLVLVILAQGRSKPLPEPVPFGRVYHAGQWHDVVVVRNAHLVVLRPGRNPALIPTSEVWLYR
jgi:hypothetical protein